MADPQIVTLSQVQAALANCTQAHPAAGHSYELAPEAAVLCELYGEMIWAKVEQTPLDALSGRMREVLGKWM
jgi:hypothetical protein